MDLFARIAEKAFGQGSLLRPRPHSWYAGADPLRAAADEPGEEAVPERLEEVGPAAMPAARISPASDSEPATPRESRPALTPAQLHGTEARARVEAVDVTGRAQLPAHERPERDTPLDVARPAPTRKRRGSVSQTSEVKRPGPRDALPVLRPSPDERASTAPQAEPVAATAPTTTTPTATPVRAPKVADPFRAVRPLSPEPRDDAVPLLAPPFPSPATVLGPGVFDAPETRAAPAADAGEPAAGPRIEVTIGRVEVRAVTPSRPAVRQSAKPPERLSLEEYLRQRPGGRP